MGEKVRERPRVALRRAVRAREDRPSHGEERFFQVPHCNGMGYRDISALAMMRRVKAEGGWAVVCSEEVEIHPPPT